MLILFEGVAMPPSFTHLPILGVLTAADDDALTDWIVALADCHGRVRSAPSLQCYEMAGRACDAMLDQRPTLVGEIAQYLPGGHWSPEVIFAEWMTGFQTIREIAARTEDDCEWYAPKYPDDPAIVAKQIAGMKRYRKAPVRLGALLPPSRAPRQ